jgi:hypothetical protein
LKPEGNETSYQQRDIERITNGLLLADAPPLKPSETGNSYYNAVPFQASCALGLPPPPPSSTAQHTLTGNAPRPLTQVLSWLPRIVLFPKFLDAAKCDHVIEIGKRRLGPSGLVLRKGEKSEAMTDIRTR